jgi:gliding motility-associated-like protein
MNRKLPLRIGLLFGLLFFCFIPTALLATHNRAGEIHIRQIGPLRVEATIVTWTVTSSAQADRPVLLIDWGDGSAPDSIRRSNGNGGGVSLPNDIKFNVYVRQHTYSGPFTYRVSMTDPNRNAGILNVNPPSSVQVPFHLETIFTFLDPQFDGSNTTPYLLQPPIDRACVGRIYKHNPNAFDPDGDSISYKLGVPLQAQGTPVPNYSYPNQIAPGTNNTLTLDERTGDIVWNAPQLAGEYNLAFMIISWRGREPIDTTFRDMQIIVERCDNNPPQIQTQKDQYCVIAKQQLVFDVIATDPNVGQFVQLSALGAPLTSPFSRATFATPTFSVLPPVRGRFTWTPACADIAPQPYSVVFKALDSLGNIPRLADLKTVQIKVVGPPPEDVQISSVNGVVEISWARPYTCQDAENNYFLGFSVWRREGANPFPLDTCMTGLAGKGYTELNFATRRVENGRFVFRDTRAERGRTYCYRVLAKFARTSSGGYPYNVVESLPSVEVCIQLKRDLPIMTNVSVLQTSTTTGRMEVRWTKPNARDLDTLLNRGPYRYEVLRATGFGPGGTFAPIASFTSNSFARANDTFYVDQNINTQGQPYRYQIAFYVGGNTTPLGNSPTASSVFLNIRSSDRLNELTWQANTPWSNYRTEIYRRIGTTGPFQRLDTTSVQTYVDRNLENRRTYCYYVRTIGTYGLSGLPDPLFNLSQEVCGSPLDTIPPCKPVLKISNLCNGGTTTPPDPPYENNLSWTNPNTACTGSKDVSRYRIWFAPDKTTRLTLLRTNEGATNTTFVHSLPDGVAGCYAVSAVDSVNNESIRSDSICVDNCPNYTLPNVFTPNNDGRNDTFRPFPGWRFVERIDLQVFNRWGNLVFSTQDPFINWNGKTNEGEDVAEGSYFYVCKVFEQRVDGAVLRAKPLSGYIEVMR